MENNILLMENKDEYIDLILHEKLIGDYKKIKVIKKGFEDAIDKDIKKSRNFSPPYI